MRPRIEGHFDGDRMWAWGSVWGKATADIAIENGYLDVINGRIAHGETGSIATSGRYALGYPRADGGDEINATVRVQDIPLEALRYAFQLNDWPVEGQLAAADLKLTGRYEKPGGTGTMRIVQGAAWGEPFEAATADLRFGGDGSVSLQRMVVEKGAGRVTGTASLSWVADTFVVSAIAEKLDMQELSTFQFRASAAHGPAQLQGRRIWQLRCAHVANQRPADSRPVCGRRRRGFPPRPDSARESRR